MRAAVIGGDKRMLYAAKAFLDRGYEVSVSGFDNLKSDGEISVMNAAQALLTCDFAVLPLPCVKGGCINAPYAKEPMNIRDLFMPLSKVPVFCGMKERLSPLCGERVFDYGKREDFQVKNAVLTAEGALWIAMCEFEGSVFGAKVLVCGYGRIGKALSKMLFSLGADVTVSARKESDFAWIEASGMRSTDYSFSEKYDYDIIFNTVPFLVLTADVLGKIARNAIVIDLASLPGGVDFAAASRLGIPAIHALALPGKHSPKSAGEAVTSTILTMIKEE